MAAVDRFRSQAKADKEKSKEEYLLLLLAFRNLLEVYEDEGERWDLMEELVMLRVGHLFERILDGLDLSLEEALQRLKSDSDHRSVEQRDERDILMAAVENLVDFATCQEYSMLRELPDVLDEQDMELYETVCGKYNRVNAVRENQEVLYAAMMAGWWLSLPEDGMLSFRTQADERVRPWHQSLEGTTYPKSNFPPELIPPIEWGCRCYLVTEEGRTANYEIDSGSVYTGTDPVFRESLARGGKIFSEEHPYFKEALPAEMRQISKRIKHKFYTP